MTNDRLVTGQPLDDDLGYDQSLRPRNLDEYVGQAHLVGPGQALRRTIEAGRPHSMVLWGPPGVGKTTLAYKLPTSKWFHYSGDYRIGTRYLDEPILDNIKHQAMQVPFLRGLLRSDSIYISNNITVDNVDVRAVDDLGREAEATVATGPDGLTTAVASAVARLRGFPSPVRTATNTREIDGTTVVTVSSGTSVVTAG